VSTVVVENFPDDMANNVGFTVRSSSCDDESNACGLEEEEDAGFMKLLSWKFLTVNLSDTVVAGDVGELKDDDEDDDDDDADDEEGEEVIVSVSCCFLLCIHEHNPLYMVIMELQKRHIKSSLQQAK
jgi:hypothetical protein